MFFDPARGARGSLVLRGDFRDELIGSDDLMLNVLRGSDLAAALALCPEGDTQNYPKWSNAVAARATAVDSCALSATGPGGGYITLVEAGGTAFTQPGDPVALHVFKARGGLYAGELKLLPAENPLSELVTFQHTPNLAGRFGDYEYEWKIAAPVDGQNPPSDATMSAYLALVSGLDLPRYLLGGSGIRVLGDNWVTLRYRAEDPAHPVFNQWSD